MDVNNHSEDNYALVVGLSVSCFIIVFICGFFFYLKLRERTGSINPLAQVSQENINATIRYNIKPESMRESPDEVGEPSQNVIIAPINRVRRKSSTISKINDFENYVKHAISKNELNQQFENIPKAVEKLCKCGKSIHNENKNRIVDQIPYDETRVVLETLENDPYSDYINANYIKGLKGDQIYVATQGPTRNTVNDFWRMIWQEDARIICMLTNIVENEQEKCEKYWPDLGEKKQYGNFAVHHLQRKQLINYTFRKFEIICNRETREVQQLHFTAWPDHGVPRNTHSVVSYLRELMKIPSENGPIVVHCSAGVGRTGSTIVSHICLLRAAYDGVIDVFSETANVREQRANMIETEQQYLFLHLVIIEYLQFSPTGFPCNKHPLLDPRDPTKTVKMHRRILENLTWLDKTLHQPSCTLPMSESQLKKHRYPHLISGALSRVNLRRYPQTDPDSEYISAVYVPGVHDPQEYIASQLPLPNTINDFWRMIAEFKIELMIVLQTPDPLDSTCCELVSTNRSLRPTPYINIRLTGIDMKNHYTVKEVELVDKSENPSRNRLVTIITLNRWKRRKQLLPPPIELVTLWQKAMSVRRNKTPIVVLCNDGVTACGIYLAMSYSIGQMLIEKEYDVRLAVRSIRQGRSDFVQSLEQFEYLYLTILTHSTYFLSNQQR